MKNGWDIITGNKREVIEIECHKSKDEISDDKITKGRLAMVVIGGIGIDSIEIRENLEIGDEIVACQEIGAFHMGGSAIVLVTSPKLTRALVRDDVAIASLLGTETMIDIGEQL